MTLIFILIALGLDFFLGGLERFRNYNWFTALFYFLEKRLAHYKLWDGSLGLLLLLAIPVSALIILACALSHGSVIFEGVLTLVVLIYCLAPEALDNRLDNFIKAIENGDAENISSLSDELIDVNVIDDEDANEKAVIKSALVEAHKRCFAVIFWFLILGAAGALLYRLVNEINDELHEIRGGFADSAKILLNILEWPSSRIMIVAMALAGSLSDVFSGWKKSEHLSFDVNNDVIIKAGLGALQYMPEVDVPDREKSYWIDELKALINRTLIICLAILGIMTLSGRLG
ncbi:MAG: regulatory signaling modulator protein AmpE [Gammaproteobacteria bacterium]|jgi:AmpE protein